VLAVHGKVCDDLAALTATVPHPHLADLAARAVAGPARQPHLAAWAVAVGARRAARSHTYRQKCAKLEQQISLAGLSFISANRRAEIF
jgi:hypothetical protein